MTEKEQARLAELIEKKKKERLSPGEFKEFQKLMAKSKKKPSPGSSYGQPGNDFSWWSKTDLTKYSANVAPNYVPGTPIAGSNIPFNPPGVFRIALANVYGNEKVVTDPINTMSRDLYLRMFQKYRGITSYSASDLGITNIASFEVVKLIAKYERIYGVINRYSRLNLNMPYSEVEALGLTQAQADYLRGHLSDFCFDINVLIQKAQRLSVLKEFSVIADALSLFSYEYLDHENARAQIIIFDTENWGIYSDTALQAGGSISFEDNSTLPLFDFNADNMCFALDSALTALLGSDSVQKIYADLVVWFGQENMLQFIPMPIDYVVSPVYKEEMLHKMHNMETLYGSAVISSELDATQPAADIATIENSGKYWIFQNNDVIRTSLNFSLGGVSYLWNFTAGHGHLGAQSGTMSNQIIENAHILDTYRVDPTPEVVVEGSLFKFTCAQYVFVDTGNSYYYCSIESCAFYIPLYIKAFRTPAGTGASLTNWTVNPTGSNAMESAGYLALLDWAPVCITCVSGIITEAYGDMDNIIPLYPNDLSRLHTAILFSAFTTNVTARV